MFYDLETKTKKKHNHYKIKYNFVSVASSNKYNLFVPVPLDCACHIEGGTISWKIADFGKFVSLHLSPVRSW